MFDTMVVDIADVILLLTLTVINLTIPTRINSFVAGITFYAAIIGIFKIFVG